MKIQARNLKWTLLPAELEQEPKCFDLMCVARLLIDCGCDSYVILHLDLLDQNFDRGCDSNAILQLDSLHIEG